MSDQEEARKSYKDLTRAGRAIAREVYIRLCCDYVQGEQPCLYGDEATSGAELRKKLAQHAVAAAESFEATVGGSDDKA